MQSRETTNYLRGMAICAVLIVHYLIRYATGDFRSLAAEAISLFFVLSGFGIFHSLERRFSGGYTLRGIAKFYFDRGLRIFLLFTVALIIGHMFNMPSYWFVFAIFFCYFVCILLYHMLKRLGPKAFSVAILSTFLLINGSLILLGYSTPSQPAFTYPYLYRGILLAHIFLFSMGMAVASVLKNSQPLILLKRSQMFIMFAFLLLLMKAGIGPLMDKIRILLLFLCAPLLVYSFLISKEKLPFANFFALLGTYSYSIYLFHYYYMQLMGGVGFIQMDSVVSILLVILLFPLFLSICMASEEAFSRKNFLKLWNRSFGALIQKK
ncbi:MAG: acyltransferase [Candidatus Micrarchaeota archaeon]